MGFTISRDVSCSAGASGYFDLRLLDGAKVHASASCKKLRLLQASSTLLTERRAAIPPAS